MVLIKYLFSFPLSVLFMCLSTCPHPDLPWWHKWHRHLKFKFVSMCLYLICNSLWLIQVLYETCIIFAQSGGLPPASHLKYISVKGHMNHCSFFLLGFAHHIIKHGKTLNILWCFNLLNSNSRQWKLRVPVNRKHSTWNKWEEEGWSHRHSHSGKKFFSTLFSLKYFKHNWYFNFGRSCKSSRQISQIQWISYLILDKI